jgi:glutamate synthase domain-containing protein 1
VIRLLVPKGSYLFKLPGFGEIVLPFDANRLGYPWVHEDHRVDQLQEALEAALEDLDGFYTFAIGTADGFAVLRDPIACKPAVLAETDDYVAMASEFQALADLPGIDEADVWEPKPAQVYTWGAAN